MLKLFFISLFLISFCRIGLTQKQKQDKKDMFFTYLDTVHIQRVDVISSVSKKYQVGSKIQHFTPLQKHNIDQGSLADLITRYAPVYIKSDAGGLSSFQFRGTNSNHTSVLVGGLNINSLTLGSSNVNSIPIFLFDNIDLMFGSSSATNGSGSIGGSVRMDLTNTWTKGVKGEAMVSAGSFDEYMTGTKVFVGNGKFESVTRLLYYTKGNNFKFKNTADYDYVKKGYNQDTQHFSSIRDKHILQEFNFKISPKQKITSMIWLSDNWHEIQPNMAQNTSSSLTSEPIKDQSVRTWINYENNERPINFFIGGGYVLDKEIDNSNTSQSIGTQRFVGEVGIKQKLGLFKYTTGIKYRYIIPKVYAYDKNIKEQQIDYYASLLYQINTKLSTTLNLRQQFITKYNAPFTPALGIDYKLLSNEHNILKLTGNIQRSYRIPTFNDRYWGQKGYTGNKDLEPEDGINCETGIKYTRNTNNTTLRVNANYYYMNVNNWLLWTQGPTGWRANNVQKVVSKGFEFHTDLSIKTGTIEWLGAINYAYNSTVRKRSSISTDILNRQLEYAPENIANTQISGIIKNTGIIVDASYTGKRYYNQISKYMDPYTLTNVSAFHKIKLNKHLLKINFQVNNIFNVSYQNQYKYAMPEINYKIAIKYIL